MHAYIHAYIQTDRQTDNQTVKQLGSKNVVDSNSKGLVEKDVKSKLAAKTRKLITMT